MSVIATPDRTAAPVAAAAVVDAAALERVLVLGSYPPTGRDLDVLARPGERDAIVSALARAGFAARGPRLAPPRPFVEQWVRFAGGAALVVDLHRPERYELSDAQVEQLFADAVPIEGMRALARCAPHHVLLLAARGLVRRRGALGAKRLHRVRRAALEDPDCWARARALAPAWGLGRALTALERAVAGDSPAGRLDRARAQLELVTAAPRRLERAALSVLAHRPHPARVVSVSGLDGAGKSSQALAVQELMAAAGVDAVVAWMPLGHSPRHRTLRLLRRTAGRLLRARRGRRDPDTRPAIGDPNPVRGARERSELITHGWVTVVAVVQALQHRRAVLRHLGTGRLVIFDRYVLDTTAQLRYFYGAQHRFEFQKRLVRFLSPRATVSFLLDVPAETVAMRKPLQYSFEEVCLQAGLYKDELEQTDVVWLDGERPQTELTDELAASIWREVGR
jgi:thymidylate kinase